MSEIKEDDTFEFYPPEVFEWESERLRKEEELWEEYVKLIESDEINDKM